MKKRLRLVRRFVRSMVMLALVCAGLLFLFPEWCMRVVVMNVMSGAQCTVKEVRFHYNRVDVQGMRVATASFTADVAAAVLQRHGGQWQLNVASGALVLAAAPASSSPAVQGTSSWTTLPVIAPPMAFCVRISNLAVQVAASPRLPQFELLCHIEAVADARQKTQVWAAVTTFFAGQSNSEARVALWQSGNDTGIELPGAAFDAAPLLKATVPGLTVKSSPAQLSGSAAFAPVWGTASLVRAACDLRVTAPSMSYKPLNLKIRNPRLSATINTLNKRTLTLTYVPLDPIGYLLQRFNADITVRVDEVRFDKLCSSNVVAVARVISNRFELVDARAEVYGGIVNANGMFERRKVKGKDAYRFLYSATLGVTNVDAGTVCRVFKMDTNRVEGVYNGAVSAAGFGDKVTSFNGGLQSSGAGTLYFPQSREYVASQQEGTKKQITDVMIQQLQQYPFDSSRIAVQYMPTTTTTVFNLEFSGIGKYAFPIDYNYTWLDAIKILMSLK